MIKLFDLLRIAGDDLAPKQCKLHFVSPDPGRESELLGEVLSDQFDKNWQRHQKRKEFERPHIVTLIPLIAGADKWLFVGCWDSLGSGRGSIESPVLYRTKKRNQTRDLVARVVVSHNLVGHRSRYQNAENLADKLIVSELLPEPPIGEKFPGYRNVDLSFSQLRTIIDNEPHDWRARLEAVGCVYVIADSKTGKMYVGIAHGEGGVWNRWAQYAENGHGGNKRLREVLGKKGKKYAENFRFSILEIADREIAVDDLRKRESHWKNVFQTRAHGYNEN